MTRIVIKRLSWDAYNAIHITKHGVSRKEVEYVCQHILLHKKAKKGRYALYARVGTRLIAVFVRREKPNTYYPVSARDAARKERKFIYEKERKEIT